MTGLTFASLDGFTLRAAADPAKRDLEVIHVPCGTRVCDAEANDDMDVLAEVTLIHTLRLRVAGCWSGSVTGSRTSTQTTPTQRK